MIIKKYIFSESIAYIPIENLFISFSKRRDGSRLIAGLLIFAFTLVAPMSLFGIFRKAEESTAGKIYYASWFILVALSFLVMIVFGIWFLFRQDTNTFSHPPEGNTIEFYKTRKNKRILDLYVRIVTRRKNLINQRSENTIKGPVFLTITKPEGYFLQMFFLFSIPALMIEKLYLFLLDIIPLFMLLKFCLEHFAKPREIRIAERYFQKKKFEKAKENLLLLLSKNPNNSTALILLATVYLWQEKYDEAIKTANQIPETDDFFKNDFILRLWDFKRIYQRRKYRHQ